MSGAPKRFGQVPGSNGEFGRFVIVTDPVHISRKILAALCDRLEARLPDATHALRVSQTQAEVNHAIDLDRNLIDQARHVLRPRQ